MDTKLLEDLAAVARSGSLVRAAASRHVTHPAFGRRLKALEAWAGVALIDRAHRPLALTDAGRTLLEQGTPLLQALADARRQLPHCAANAGVDRAVRIGTGRTLARTLVADWLARLHGMAASPLRGRRIDLVTGAMADIAAQFEAGAVDLLCCYEHPALSMRLSGHRFRHISLAHDKLVPVSRADAQGRARHGLEQSPLLTYSDTLALGRLLRDHRSHAAAADEQRGSFRCDSADALLALALKGAGVAWLPWSLAAADCRRGLLVRVGARSDEVHFEVRLYRPRARQRPTIEALWAATDR